MNGDNGDTPWQDIWLSEMLARAADAYEVDVDPDDTLKMTLLQREVFLIMFGLGVAGASCPEMWPHCVELLEKFGKTIHVQKHSDG